MLNKSTIKDDTKNSAFTPKQVNDALDNLPYNYIVEVQKLLDKKIQEGGDNKNYSKNYIISVRKGDAFNEDILTALIEVGHNHYEKVKRLGVRNKKTPSAN